MVAIPCIKDSFLHACRYRSGLTERGLSVMCSPSGVGIERLHVHGPPWFLILLRAYDHPVAVCHWVANGDRLDHTESHIVVQPGFDFLLPMHRTGVWWATGAASGSTMSLSGGPCIIGSS